MRTNNLTYSHDRRWRIRDISLNGRKLKRLEHDTMMTPYGVIIHRDTNRMGPVQVAGGWWLVGDFTRPEQLEEYILLSEFE